MPLSSESIYDELSGQECKEILLQRVKDLLDSVPDFQRHLTLPRVHMALKIHLDIYGRRNSALDLLNDFTIKTKEPEQRIELAQELEAEDEISADTGAPVPGTPFDGAGAPPDQVREEHGLPVMEPVRDRVTRSHAQRPASPPQQQDRMPVPQRRSRPPGFEHYAGFHVLERAGAARFGHTEYLEDAAPITKTPQAVDSLQDRPVQREIGIQKDFRDNNVLSPENK